MSSAAKYGSRRARMARTRRDCSSVMRFVPPLQEAEMSSLGASSERLPGYLLDFPMPRPARQSFARLSPVSQTPLYDQMPFQALLQAHFLALHQSCALSSRIVGCPISLDELNTPAIVLVSMAYILVWSRC